MNCASALGSRVRRVPRIAAMKPRGMLMMPGLVSGTSGAAWIKCRLAAGTSAASIPMIEGLRMMRRMLAARPTARPQTAPAVVKRPEDAQHDDGQVCARGHGKCQTDEKGDIDCLQLDCEENCQSADDEGGDRATRTSSPGDRSFPWWMTLV